MIAGNFELQQAYLTDRQQEISARLFESGVVSRLILGGAPSGAAFSVEGVDQLDKVFVPGLQYARSGGATERVLSLVAMNQQGSSQSFKYFGIGELDTAADILFPYPDVEAQDAEAVHQTARELLAAQQEGILPDLSGNLLSIDNPNTMIRLLSPDEH